MTQDSALDHALENSRLYQRFTASDTDSDDNIETAETPEMTLNTTITNSRLYSGLVTLWKWKSSSRVLAILNDQRVLLAGAILFVLASVGRIMVSGLHVSIRFLSFALLTAVLLVLVWPYTEPLTDG